MLLSLIAALLVTDSLRTEVIFLSKGGMGADRALVIYDRVLGPTPEGSATIGRQPNMLVVRDTPQRLSRFRALMKALDVPGGEMRLYLRPLRYVEPSVLKPMLEEIGGFDPTRVTLVPDDRSGQLVVQSRLEDYRRLDALIRRLDVQSNHGRRIRVTPGPSEGGFPP